MPCHNVHQLFTIIMPLPLPRQEILAFPSDGHRARPTSSDPRAPATSTVMSKYPLILMPSTIHMNSITYRSRQLTRTSTRKQLPLEPLL